jgi:hypothetical protein
VRGADHGRAGGLTAVRHGAAMGDSSAGSRNSRRKRALTAWRAACGVGAVWPARLAPRASSTSAVVPRGRRSTRSCATTWRRSTVPSTTGPSPSEWLRGLLPPSPSALAYDRPLCASLDGFRSTASSRRVGDPRGSARREREAERPRQGPHDALGRASDLRGLDPDGARAAHGRPRNARRGAPGHDLGRAPVAQHHARILAAAGRPQRRDGDLAPERHRDAAAGARPAPGGPGHARHGRAGAAPPGVVGLRRGRASAVRCAPAGLAGERAVGAALPRRTPRPAQGAFAAGAALRDLLVLVARGRVRLAARAVRRREELPGNDPAAGDPDGPRDDARASASRPRRTARASRSRAPPSSPARPSSKRSTRPRPRCSMRSKPLPRRRTTNGAPPCRARSRPSRRRSRARPPTRRTSPRASMSGSSSNTPPTTYGASRPAASCWPPTRTARSGRSGPTRSTCSASRREGTARSPRRPGRRASPASQIHPWKQDDP